jgi:oligopeptide transport system permease protein
MLGYTVRRILHAALVILIAATLVFVIMRLMPGGPFDVENIMNEEARTNLIRLYGLHLPIYQQYGKFIYAALHGDFGTSYKYRGMAVSEIIATRLPVSALLGLCGILFVAMVGIPLGIIAASKRNSGLDYGIMFFASLGYAIPNFVMALLLLLVFALKAGLFPVGGWGGGMNLVLPAFAIGLPGVCIVARLTRSSMINTLQEDYIRTAQAKGLKRSAIVVNHAFRNALIPVITVLGVIGSYMLCGSIVIERIFAIPGLGNFFATSIQDADYPVVMGLTLVFATIIVLMNLVIDLVYGIIDPRIAYD